jgi:hypothetical protein
MFLVTTALTSSLQCSGQDQSGAAQQAPTPSGCRPQCPEPPGVSACPAIVTGANQRAGLFLWAPLAYRWVLSDLQTTTTSWHRRNTILPHRRRHRHLCSLSLVDFPPTTSSPTYLPDIPPRHNAFS